LDRLVRDARGSLQPPNCDGMVSHDHNFKNVFLDFPTEALEWILPDVPAKMGKIRHVKFDRQEPGKRRRILLMCMPGFFDDHWHKKIRRNIATLSSNI
jgi:hypothetical protein